MRLLLICLSLSASVASAAPPGLTVGKDGTLQKDGASYHGIGVNYFDAFARLLRNPDDTSYDQGFRILSEHGIPFARFLCTGFWPVEMSLYLEDKPEYFRRLDAVIASAEKHDIGLIPSLFWQSAAVPDLVGEPCDAWGDPQSQTHAFMRTYVREIVTRYQMSPAIWGWEFGNEYNLLADLPNAPSQRPAVFPQRGTPAQRTTRDELTHEMVRVAVAAFAQEVRKHDLHRFLSTGNSFPRPSAWHQKTETTWTQDTPAQQAEMLVGDNPDPIDTLSVHAYGDGAAESIRFAMEVSAKCKKPVFVGEFGAKGVGKKVEEEFLSLLETIEQTEVPLAAVWVFDYGGQDDLSITDSNARAYQLKALARANRRKRETAEDTRPSESLRAPPTQPDSSRR